MPYMTQVGTYSSKTNNIYNFYIFPQKSDFVSAYRSSTQFANLTDLFRKTRPKTDPISQKGLLTDLGLLKQTHFVTLLAMPPRVAHVKPPGPRIKERETERW